MREIRSLPAIIGVRSVVAVVSIIICHGGGQALLRFVVSILLLRTLSSQMVGASAVEARAGTAAALPIRALSGEMLSAATGMTGTRAVTSLGAITGEVASYSRSQYPPPTTNSDRKSWAKSFNLLSLHLRHSTFSADRGSSHSLERCPGLLCPDCQFIEHN